MAKSKKHWCRFRHRIVRNFAYAVLYPYARLRYGITIEKFKEQRDRPYLILLNHQTPFDQFFAGMAFRGAVYYMATEDIFSMGWLSSLIRFLVAPIPIRKQTTDVQAVRICLRVAKEGGTICIAPEGNRTYSGRTEYMNPAIAPLARKLNMPVALFRIEGGYGSEPRWSDVIRRGRMRAYVSEVIEPETIAALSDEELYTRIKDGLYVDEACVKGEFFHKRCAEYLERVVYVCPQCGFSVFESHGDTVTCQTCHTKVRYLPTKELQGIEEPFPFRFVAEWYDYQKEFVNRTDTRVYTEMPLYRDRAAVSEVLLYKRKVPLYKDAKIAVYGDHFMIEDRILPFSDIKAVTVLGRNKANIYYGEQVYQLKGNKRFNALKYVHLYHRYCNLSKENEYVEFLGL